jgi:hypothetical protein
MSALPINLAISANPGLAAVKFNRLLTPALDQALAPLMLFLAKELLKKQNVALAPGSDMLMLSGGGGFEEIVDKNVYLQNNIPYTSDADLLLGHIVNGGTGNIIRSSVRVAACMRNMYNNIDDNIICKLYGILHVYQRIIAEQRTNQQNIGNNLDLNPQIYMKNILDIFRQSFFIGQRMSAMSGIIVYYIAINFNGVPITLVESSEKVKELTIGMDVLQSYISLLSPHYYLKELTSLETDPTYTKKAKNQQRKDILIAQGQLDNANTVLFKKYRLCIDFDLQSTPITATPVSDYFIKKHAEIILSNTSPSPIQTAQHTVQYENKYYAPNKFTKSLTGYSCGGNWIVNNMLIAHDIITNNNGQALNKNFADIYYPGYMPVPYMCDTPYNDYVSLTNLFAALANAGADNKKYIFNTVRLANPCAYHTHFIDHYKSGDTLRVPAFLSTTHKITIGMQMFLKESSPLVIFVFRFSDMSTGKFVFMEKFSFYPNQYEVILKDGIEFKIIHKAYKNIRTNNNIVQKLFFFLAPKDDTDAINSLINDPLIRSGENQYSGNCNITNAGAISANTNSIFSDLSSSNTSQYMRSQPTNLHITPASSADIMDESDLQFEVDNKDMDISGGKDENIKNLAKDPVIKGTTIEKISIKDTTHKDDNYYIEDKNIIRDENVVKHDVVTFFLEDLRKDKIAARGDESINLSGSIFFILDDTKLVGELKEGKNIKSVTDLMTALPYYLCNDARQIKLKNSVFGYGYVDKSILNCSPEMRLLFEEQVASSKKSIIPIVPEQTVYKNNLNKMSEVGTLIPTYGGGMSVHDLIILLILVSFICILYYLHANNWHHDNQQYNSYWQYTDKWYNE